MADPRRSADPPTTARQAAPEIARVLIPRDAIARRVRQLGEQITSTLTAAAAPPPFEPGPVVLVPVLTGALVFVADLIRHVPLPLSIRPVTVSSYAGPSTTSAGASVQSAVPTDLGGARVVIVDDILDSGRTLGLLRRLIAAQEPQSLHVAVLLRKQKPGGRAEPVAVDFACFDIDDHFVVGYGLDYDGLFRNLPDVAALRVPGA